MADTKSTTSKKPAAAKPQKANKSVRASRLQRVVAHGSGFMAFIREQGVIGLAVGLAIGTAAGDTVKKLVQGFITPIVQFIVGSQTGLENATWHLKLWGRTADFQWGAFVSSAITLLAVAFVVYFIVKGLRLDKLDKPKEDA